jgi:hypothetical protein
MFSKAIAAFANADDFVMSFSDGGYQVAEDICDRIAVERKLNQASYEERGVIEAEIEGAVSFYNGLSPAFLILLVALLEDYLLEICELVAQEKKISFKQVESDPNKLLQAKLFLEKELGIQFPVPWAAWEKLQKYTTRRNTVIKMRGLGYDSLKISDDFLVELNKAAVIFFQELQEYLNRDL